MRAPEYICLASATSIMTVGAMEYDLRIWLLGTLAMFTGAVITEVLPATPRSNVAETPTDDPRKGTE